MEGQLKELPQEEFQEQADDVSEQHMGAEKLSGGQVSEYPQCCLEDLNGDGCRKLAGESLDECTEEQVAGQIASPCESQETKKGRELYRYRGEVAA